MTFRANVILIHIEYTYRLCVCVFIFCYGCSISCNVFEPINNLMVIYKFLKNKKKLSTYTWIPLRDPNRPQIYPEHFY